MKKEQLLLMLFRTLYFSVFRAMLEAKVKSTPNEWDDRIIPLLDALLNETK